MAPVSSGSATNVAEAAKSMKSSSTMIWIGANGKRNSKDDWDKEDRNQGDFAG